jgi:5-methylcytosine-specific restriction endonuclease McrBC GTP-binding regulatory subunit McrB
MRAKDDPLNPYFIILDEMNLSKVEYYFSDFLSIMESRTGDSPEEGEPFRLHEIDGGALRSGGADSDTIPSQLHMPNNVFITGTVNVDESTYMFSPKVLDRANVIEFNEVRLYGSETDTSHDDSFRLAKPELDRATCLGGERFASRRNYDAAKKHLEAPLSKLLKILSPYHLHFGYRVINEFSRFVTEAETLVGDSKGTIQAAIDIQILQKILPKFHGTRAKLKMPLRELLSFCYQDDDAAPSEKIEKASGLYPNAQYPRSAKKIARMLRTLDEQGYVSFIE